MLTKETLDYITNWEKELNKINGNELYDYFNRFQTLFPIYNRLYSHIINFENSSKKQQNRISDYEKATTVVRDFIGSDIIIEKLVIEDRIKDIETIADLIDKKMFNINLKDGIGQEEFDKQLCENLLNDKDNAIRSKAVLSVIYNVRCNLVHGYKNIEEHQKRLLEPIFNLLLTIFKTLKECMK
ncbi:hypothetical protein C7448_11345 [Tenacibaculum gallaicum]|uniref:Apea-like HEPN domain-containing protein n=1 Tax=Tenacibaculum gallaicum TaxID=561505 RepID=A0A3E0HDU4_9FLAO|nr:hypothetical protein [Tenacibaculum gallaicum]REH43444.1 hypothetical protein C7448_11345 [Tenacibaculum gallaicum]